MTRWRWALRIVVGLFACMAGGYIYVRYLEPNWIVVSGALISCETV